MTLPRGFAIYAALALVLGASLVALIVLGPRWLASTPIEPATSTDTAPAADARKIRARLFYVNEAGTGLTAVEQEVVYGEGAVEQARHIIQAQLAPPPPPLVSSIPAGTRLRSLFLTNSGDLYLDFSGELQSNHPGGTTSEILTVYAIVHALTANLPAVTAVQILIDGREADTLAGHLDLRRPIAQDPRWTDE